VYCWGAFRAHSCVPPLIKLTQAEIGRIREGLIAAGLLGATAGRNAA